MYFAMYNRFLESIGETYTVESWQRTQRAMDFDSLKITGEQIPYSAEPFIVEVCDRQGRQLFSGLASTPEINDKSKKTTITLKDYTTLFNTEVVVNWSNLNQENLSLDRYFKFIFKEWITQTDVGFKTFKLDTTRLKEVLWDTEIPLGEGVENVSMHDLVYEPMSYYKLYCIPTLDVQHKTLTFTFYPVGKYQHSVKLKDLGITSLNKSFGEVNRVTVYNRLYEKISQWAITEDNSIVKLPSNKELVYPAKNKNFIAEEPSEDLTEQQALWDATYEAVMELTNNLYQEDIEIDLQAYSSVIGSVPWDFSYMVTAYTDDGVYKNLPVGEIETDSKGKHIIRLGYRVQELTQEL